MSKDESKSTRVPSIYTMKALRDACIELNKKLNRNDLMPGCGICTFTELYSPAYVEILELLKCFAAFGYEENNSTPFNTSIGEYYAELKHQKLYENPNRVAFIRNTALLTDTALELTIQEFVSKIKSKKQKKGNAK